MSWQLVLTGLLVGILVGATGMGGGSLMTPILIFLFGFHPQVAVGTDIVHGALFKSVGAVRHRRLGTVQAQLSGWMLVGSGPMSLLGVAAAAWLASRHGDGTQSAMARVLGATLLLGAAGLFAKSFVRYRERPDTPFRMTRRDRIAAVTLGAAGGFLVGLTSIGSGVFFALTLLIVFPLRSSKVVGTDIFHAAALLWIAGAGHLVVGKVDTGAVAWLLLGSIPGVLLASRLTVDLPDRLLRVALACVLALSGIKLVGLPGADLLVATAVPVLVVAGVTALVLGRRRPLDPARAAERNTF
jgi:uncharacterized membrane protein YfcA